MNQEINYIAQVGSVLFASIGGIIAVISLIMYIFLKNEFGERIGMYKTLAMLGAVIMMLSITLLLGLIYLF